MSKIERRRRVVSLHHGHYEAELTALLDKMMAAQRAEAAEEFGQPSDAPLRAGQKKSAPKPKESIELARQYDALLTEAEESAEKITVWAIGYDEWDHLADLHPPREDVAEDKEAGVTAKTFPEDRERGVNYKTFPPALLRLALVDPDESDLEDLDIDAKIAAKTARGTKILAGLGLSRIHFVKLETAAWNVNVGDDALPKWSAVSFLNQGSDSDSKPQNNTE